MLGGGINIDFDFLPSMTGMIFLNANFMICVKCLIGTSFTCDNIVTVSLIVLIYL